MSSEPRSFRMTACYAATILLSSFLIFQVQPLISKYILPWFGGTPGVWSTCMLFFQVVLFAGYAYAHLIISRLSPSRQCALHVGLIALALCLLPITPAATWKPIGTENPTWRILGLLTISVGLPYFILSATGPLLQAWFSRVAPGTSPYRLYALSNIGSVAGLVTYPFLVEPALAAESQAALWSWSFVAFGACCALCAIVARKVDLPPSHALEAIRAEPVLDQPAPSTSTRWAWFLLATCASVMLLATTNQVCLDVAVVPFLWVLPLSLYLVSFILCFDHARWYPRREYSVALFASMISLTYLLSEGENAPLLTQIVAHFAALFFCCMVCHGELVRLKPSPRHLTSFYLASSAGGATGGILVALIAPLIFHRYLELHLAIAACCVVCLFVFFRDRDGFLYRGQPRWAWACLLVCCLLLVRGLRVNASQVLEGQLEESRNFYGVLRIGTGDIHDPESQSRLMMHGRILHGCQFTAATKRNIPTAYYGEQSGAGILLRNLPQVNGLRVGVVGLGAGTLAAYGNPGDTYRFYEINADVIRLAQEHFTYLQDCPAQVEHVLGDARLSLEREAPQQFDALILDAFSSDAIPTHLLTREAFAVYLKHLRPEGVIAVHISNRHFDLEPVLAAAAAEFDLAAGKVESEGNPDRRQTPAHWMLLAREPRTLTIPKIQAALRPASTDAPRVRIWTDNYSNVVGVLKGTFRSGH